jgi:hypothetical protein
MLRLAAFADDVAGFDAAAFRLARAEAVALDPQSSTLLHHVATARQVRPHCVRKCSWAFFAIAPQQRLDSCTSARLLRGRTVQ